MPPVRPSTRWPGRWACPIPAAPASPTPPRPETRRPTACPSPTSVCLAGGVAANGRLRQLVNDGAQKLGAKVYLPELKFCGDNGAMIAAQGYYQYIAGHTAGLELNGLPTLPIDYE